MVESYPDKLVFIDIEHTGGWEPSHGRILEVGFLITDLALNKIDSRSWVIHLEAVRLGGMEDWCLRQHGRSGLIADSAASKLSLDSVSAQARGWLGGRGPGTGTVPMAGASVHLDRSWLKYWLPEVEKWFYYGNLDVSSVEKLARLWYPELDPWEDRGMHRVDPDNEDAVAELQFYRDHILRAPGDIIQIT